MAKFTFDVDVAKFVKKVDANGEWLMRRLAFQGFHFLLMTSPVDTGRFRHSWRVSLNRVDLSFEPELGPGGFGGATFGAPASPQEYGKLLDGLDGLRWGDTIWITNNTPYANKLEGSDGEKPYSAQAPNGMLKIVFPVLQAQVQALVRGLS